MIRFGNCNNVQLRFSISHLPDVEDMDNLDIDVCSGDNQDFYCKTTMHAVTAEVIDRMCEQLQALKSDLRSNV